MRLTRRYYRLCLSFAEENVFRVIVVGIKHNFNLSWVMQTFLFLVLRHLCRYFLVAFAASPKKNIKCIGFSAAPLRLG